MSGSCDEVLINLKGNTACDYIYNNLETCSGQSIINYRLIYFCYMNQNYLIGLPIFGVCFIFYFYIISDTAQEYLTPSLAKMTKFFKFSESLAGVTFLAFGNASPDVISSIVSSGTGIHGVYLSLSGLIGACAILSFFLTPLVVLLSEKDIQLHRETYGKDILFQLLGLFGIFGFFMYGQINWKLALCFPVLYLIYVGISVYQESKRKKEEEEIRKNTQKFEEDFETAKKNAENKGEEIVRKEGKETFVVYTHINPDSFIEDHVNRPIASSTSFRESKIIKTSEKLARTIKSRLWQNMEYFAIEITEYPAEEEEKKRGLFGKLFHCLVVVPWKVIRNISIPPCDEENWSRIRASYFPVPTYLVITIFFESARPNTITKALIFVGIILLGILLSILILFSTKTTRAPKFLIVFTIISFLISLIWIWGWTNLLIDLLQFIGVMLNIPVEFLAIIFLALGNSLPDITTDIAVSKMGLSEMALTGCISAPVFFTLVGFGGAMARGTLNYGPVPFNFTDKQAILPFIGLVITLYSQFVYFICYCINGFKLKRVASYSQLFTYTFFFGIILTFTILLRGKYIR